MADAADLMGEMEEKMREMQREKERETSRDREVLRALDRLGRVLEEAVHTVSSLKQLYEEGTG
jgi:hypothetical protein